MAGHNPAEKSINYERTYGGDPNRVVKLSGGSRVWGGGGGGGGGEGWCGWIQVLVSVLSM